MLDGLPYVYVHQTTPERFTARLMLGPGLPCNNLSVTEGKTWILGGRHGYVAADEIRKELEAAGETVPDRFALVTYFPPSGRDRAQHACDVKQYVEGLHVTFSCTVCMRFRFPIQFDLPFSTDSTTLNARL